MSTNYSEQVLCMECLKIFCVYDEETSGMIFPIYSCPYCDHIGRILIRDLVNPVWFGFVLNKRLVY